MCIGSSLFLSQFPLQNRHSNNPEYDLDACYHSGSIHMQTHTQKHDHNCMYTVCLWWWAMGLHSPCLDHVRVGAHYFAFLLGVACVTNIPVSGRGRELWKSLSIQMKLHGLSNSDIKHSRQILCPHPQTHAYHVVWQSAIQQGAVKTAKTVSEGTAPHDCRSWEFHIWRGRKEEEWKEERREEMGSSSAPDGQES